MLNEKCLTIEGYNVCWEEVAKPYEFINKKCQMIDERIWCFDHIINKYKDPEQYCVRYSEEWVCADRIQMTWVTGGCVNINGHDICGNDFYRLAAQKCVIVDGVNICPDALGGHKSIV